MTMQVPEIIEAAGGEPRVMVELNITQMAIRNWWHRGIPERYWRAFMRMANVSGEMLLAANQAAKRKKKRSRGKKR